jgi:thiosulfate reductase cytochrome b subunit
MLDHYVALWILTGLALVCLAVVLVIDRWRARRSKTKERG